MDNQKSFAIKSSEANPQKTIHYMPSGNIPGSKIDSENSSWGELSWSLKLLSQIAWLNPKSAYYCSWLLRNIKNEDERWIMPSFCILYSRTASKDEMITNTDRPATWSFFFFPACFFFSSFSIVPQTLRPLTQMSKLFDEIQYRRMHSFAPKSLSQTVLSFYTNALPSLRYLNGFYEMEVKCANLFFESTRLKWIRTVIGQLK